MFTKGMAIDWVLHGLQVNAIGPGYFKTELNQALVGMAVYLASNAASFIDSHVLHVDVEITSSLEHRKRGSKCALA